MQGTTTRSYETATDAELMNWFYEGDRHAFDRLAWRLQPSLLHQALNRLPRRHVGRLQSAEDLVQKTLIKAAMTLDRPEIRWHASKGGAVATWMTTILRNTTTSFLRTRASRQTVCADLVGSGETEERSRVEERIPDHRIRIERSMRRAEVQRLRQLEAIDRLPARLRDILTMKIEGQSHRQIARHLGVSKSTISDRIHRAAKVLRDRPVVAA